MREELLGTGGTLVSTVRCKAKYSMELFPQSSAEAAS